LALWLPAKQEWRELFRGAPDGDYVLVKQTAEYVRCVTREVLRHALD